jgi:predicted PurR-regulated permease PerM
MRIGMAMKNKLLEQKFFLMLLTAVSVAFVWILLPFYGAVFWAVILAIIFAPLHRRLIARFPNRRNLAALLALLVCVLIAVLPMIFITGSLVQEGAALYQQMKGGQLEVGSFLERFKMALPTQIQAVLDRLGAGDLASLREKLSEAALQGSQFVANQAVNIGQNTFQFVVAFFVMLYLLFFFFRDGAMLSRRIRDAVPLGDRQKHLLFTKFITVVRATVKGNIIVAVTQGVLGGLIFRFFDIQGAVLWGVLMAFLSLLPAVGAGLVWGPVAVYFLVTGAVWQGVVLTLYGIFVIGLVDNILRPLLVGKDTKMPDYLVLMSTLGGMALFGLNGFVIGPLIAALFMAAWALFTDPPSDDEVAAPRPVEPVGTLLGDTGRPADRVQ